MSFSTTIDNLPPEMLCAVFEHLDLEDLVTCSAVNKFWHSVYSSSFKINRLVVTHLLDNFHDEWHSEQAVRSETLCCPEKFPHLAALPLLSNLQHLKLNSRSLDFELDKLNEFSQLVTLLFDFELRDDINLNLPKLEVLKFGFNYFNHFSVDCPKLRVLIYEEGAQSDRLDLKHPETVRRLETNMVGSKLDRFQNVECLVSSSFDAISKSTLQSLPKLNELHYGSVFTSQSQIEERDAVLRKFLNDLKTLRASDFKFIFAGFLLTSSEALDEIDFGDQTIEWIYARNHQLVEGNLEFLNYVNYNRFMRSVILEIPITFFKKLTGVRTLVIEDPVQDANHFLEFLNSLRSLKELRIKKNSGLDQVFFDLLPTSVRRLTELSIEEDYELNYNFLSLIPSLTDMGTSELSFKSLTSLIRSYGELRSCILSFNFKGRRFSIHRNKKDFILNNTTYIFAAWILKTDDPDVILKYFDELPDKSESEDEDERKNMNFYDLLDV